MNATGTARVLGAAICATLVAGTAVSVAATAAKSGTIHGCVAKKGALRVVKSASKCSSKEKAISWNSKGPQGPAGAPAATKVYQIDIGYSAANSSDTRTFLGDPATVTVAGTKTAVLVNASLDFFPTTDGHLTSYFEVCYQHGASPIQLASFVVPDFTATHTDYFAQNVTGAIGGLPAGTYKVGACSAAEANASHGYGVATIEVMQTSSGVSAVPQPFVRSKARLGARP